MHVKLFNLCYFGSIVSFFVGGGIADNVDNAYNISSFTVARVKRLNFFMLSKLNYLTHATLGALFLFWALCSHPALLFFWGGYVIIPRYLGIVGRYGQCLPALLGTFGACRQKSPRATWVAMCFWCGCVYLMATKRGPNNSRIQQTDFSTTLRFARNDNKKLKRESAQIFRIRVL